MSLLSRLLSKFASTSQRSEDKMVTLLDGHKFVYKDSSVCMSINADIRPGYRKFAIFEDEFSCDNLDVRNDQQAFNAKIKLATHAIQNYGMKYSWNIEAFPTSDDKRIHVKEYIAIIFCTDKDALETALESLASHKVNHVIANTFEEVESFICASIDIDIIVIIYDNIILNSVQFMESQVLYPNRQFVWFVMIDSSPVGLVSKMILNGDIKCNRILVIGDFDFRNLLYMHISQLRMSCVRTRDARHTP